MNSKLCVALLVGACALGGCDDKKNPAPSTDAGKVTDAAKSAADSAKQTANKAVDATKDAANKAVDAAKDAGNKAVETGKQAVDSAKAALDTKFKDAASGYSTELGKLGDMLGNVKDAMSAPKEMGGIKDQMGKVSGYVATLSTASADVKTKIMSEFKPQIDAAVAKFKAQADRISKDAMLSKVPGLADTVKNFKLFE